MFGILGALPGYEKRGPIGHLRIVRKNLDELGQLKKLQLE
jgi:hypothetical protein